MKINDLRAGMEGISIVGQVVKILEESDVETRFGKSRIAVAMIAPYAVNHIAIAYAMKTFTSGARCKSIHFYK